MLQSYLDRVVTRIRDFLASHHKIDSWLFINGWTYSHFVFVETIPILDHAYVISLLFYQIELVIALLIDGLKHVGDLI